jgi:acyl carrier protein
MSSLGSKQLDTRRIEPCLALGGPMLSFDDFSRAIGEALQIDPQHLTPESRITEDIGFDSLDYFILLTVIEELADAPPGSADDHEYFTLGQAFESYTELCDAV